MKTHCTASYSATLPAFQRFCRDHRAEIDESTAGIPLEGELHGNMSFGDSLRWTAGMTRQLDDISLQCSDRILSGNTHEPAYELLLQRKDRLLDAHSAFVEPRQGKDAGEATGLLLSAAGRELGYEVRLGEVDVSVYGFIAAIVHPVRSVHISTGLPLVDSSPAGQLLVEPGSGLAFIVPDHQAKRSNL